MTNERWILRYEGLNPEKEGLREALCTLGNGVFATRGAAEECGADDVHYPGNYLAGGYNELPSEVAGRTVDNEDLVNFPNWLWLSVRVEGGRWLHLEKMEVEDYVQELDLRAGELRRSFRVVLDEGRAVTVESRRLVHMGRPHLGAIQWRVVPQGWSGRLEVVSGLDGSVTNDNVARYRQLESKHLDVIERGTVAPEGIYLKVRTNQSDIELAQSARTRIDGVDAVGVRRWIDDSEREKIAEHFSVPVEDGEPLVVEKVVAQYSSRDLGIGDFAKSARIAVDDAPGFEELAQSQQAAWKLLWRRCDVEVEVADDQEGPIHDQLVLRLHLFHLLQTASHNTVGRDVGIPARGLHGEAYRGHIFWDELFILPFYTLRLPSVTRSAILYRYYRLDAARKLAAQAGHRGAAFPWQSGSDGREATQQLHLNPRSGQWDPDHSHLQRHINAAIVYNVWRYWEATGDRAFLEEFGAEIVLEIAKFWSSLAHYDQDRGRFEIHGVMGPDEYHEKYPGASRGGLKNNVYTNITAVWCLLRALDVLEAIHDGRARELRELLEIDDGDLQRWEAITREMIVVFHDGVMSQFEGYDELQEFDWAGYVERYGDIERLDRILKAEGDSPDRYKVSKQADMTMLLYLFRHEEVIELLGRLGYEVDDEDLRRNVDYYRDRTSHGSTLSRVVYTSVIHRFNCEAGSKIFLATLESDLCDVQGGTTEEGVHLGAMAGSVDIVKRHYAGLHYDLEGLRFEPHMPRRMVRIAFRVLHRRRWYAVELTHDTLRVSVDRAEERAVLVEVQKEEFVIEPGQTLEVAIEHPPERGEGLKEKSESAGMAPPIRLASKDVGRWPPGNCGGGGGQK